MFTLTLNFDTDLWTWGLGDLGTRGLGDLKKLSSLDIRL